ncbi:uncharacterized protein B0I36DRAFT_360373 [Microdochium trichocladiopsis]|uniref:Ketoreductase domain-containing protein n=1 Tax=Microdochium trichocladiopsis TaxID=1682393 RepID=A0A9P8YAW7_9PEZI|nr:uncharacterized protein B0I36DRAFT_360373 [Microdochium trichocladiopsis]KAH7034912.1 hypothetical protein B0I36DRAFT_360373 [Microdochium trichocladiopsis]
MFTRTAAAVALAAVGLVSAQTNSTANIFTLANPNSVELGDRVSWCVAQKNACGLFCQSLAANDCSETTLTYNCTCTNNESPDLTQYQNTLPWFICKENFAQCNAAGVGNAAVQQGCIKNIDDKCGTKNLTDASPIDATTTAPSSTSAPASSSTRPATSPTTTPNAAMVLDMQQARNGAAAVAIAAMAYMYNAPFEWHPAMGAFKLAALGVLALTVLGIAWLWSLNGKMKGVPPEALAVSPHRWTETEMRETYGRISKHPIDWTSHLPPKLDRRYVVTGGYGGVGGQIVLQLLARGQPPESIRVVDFRGPSRHDMLTGPATKVDFAQVDISSREAVDAAFSRPWAKSVAGLPLTVFHTAALIDPGRRSKWTYASVQRVNVDGTRNIVEASKAAGATVLVYTCSSSVGLRPVRFWNSPFAAWHENNCQFLAETDFDKPVRPHAEFFGNYAHSKAVAERLVCDANSPSFRTGSIRPANCIYGSSEADQAVGLVLRKGTVPTWMPNIIQNFVHGGHVSLGHLQFEAALLSSSSSSTGAAPLPKCAGRAYNISDAGPPPAFADMYNLLKLTSEPPGRIQVKPLQPALLLAISYIVELFDVAAHMPVLGRLISAPKGDLATLQPTVFTASTHTLATDAAACKSIADGGIGFRHVCTSMEGMAGQAAEWNQRQAAAAATEKV